jgi:hypothetical protein
LPENSDLAGLVASAPMGGIGALIDTAAAGAY